MLNSYMIIKNQEEYDGSLLDEHYEIKTEHSRESCSLEDVSQMVSELCGLDMAKFAVERLLLYSIIKR